MHSKSMKQHTYTHEYSIPSITYEALCILYKGGIKRELQQATS